MIQSKKMGIITTFMVCIALVFNVLIVGFRAANSEKSMIETPQYATAIFGTDIISIDILADETEWQTMVDNGISEQFIMADVIVNGTTFQSVGIRPKGNSSLTQVANSDSNRYSFRLQFDEYIKDQTCFGLQSFVVNNIIGDNTYMKEYISYDLMETLGVDCPYFGFANLQLNGEKWGLYLAVELYNDSYENRMYGTTKGMLYNVKSVEMGGENNKTSGQNMPARTQGEEKPQWDETLTDAPVSQPVANPDVRRVDADTVVSSTTEPSQPNAQTGGGFSKGGMNMGKGGGGSLEYTDDSSTSYRSIFDNAVGKSTESDYQRVITALQALSNGTELETYFDVEQILPYLAVHTFVVNLDSYSSSMAQNYYIYENNGKLSILPWDYNLAWGGFQSGSAASTINFPIDTPVSGVELSTRPLIEKLFANQTYLDLYHSYLQTIVDEYFADGKFDEKVNALNAAISSYVQEDATAFCTFEEYQLSLKPFITLGNLRAQSVLGQLNGTVPSTTQGQKELPNALISSENLNLSDLGTMMGGKEGGGRLHEGNFSPNSDDMTAETTVKAEDKKTAPPTEKAHVQSETPPVSTEKNQKYWRNMGLLMVLLLSVIVVASKCKKNY